MGCERLNGVPEYWCWEKVPANLKTKTTWRKERRIVKPDAKPLGQKLVNKGADGAWPLYSEEQTAPMRVVRSKPALVLPQERENVLLSIFTVNKAAKRYRNAATKCYEAKAHGFASTQSGKKGELYGLKDRGIAFAHQQGWIVPEGLHGRLCIYRGTGFCFHSPLVPAEMESVVVAEDQDLVLIDAKPKTSKELRLRDAVALLSSLPNGTAAYKRLEAPDFRARVKEEDQPFNSEDDKEDANIDAEERDEP